MLLDTYVNRLEDARHRALTRRFRPRHTIQGGYPAHCRIGQDGASVLNVACHPVMPRKAVMFGTPEATKEGGRGGDL